jgi:hypothetical protein
METSSIEKAAAAIQAVAKSTGKTLEQYLVEHPEEYRVYKRAVAVSTQTTIRK